MHKFPARYAHLAVLSVGLFASAARAQEPGSRLGPPPVGSDQVPRGGFADMGPGSRTQAADAVRRAQAESGGRVLGAERVQFDGRDIMRVKVMDGSGRVRYMDDDPSDRLQRRGGGAERNGESGQRPREPNLPRP